MNTEGLEPADAGDPGLAERWIVSRLQETAREVERNLAAYRFDLASQALYEFIWNEYCDWYLELSKPVLYDDSVSPDRAQATRHTLVGVLEATLRLLHPFMPFITEEIWQRVAPVAGRSGPTIMLASYPEPDAGLIDPGASADIDWLKGVVVAVRNIRGEMNIPPGRALPLLLVNGGDEDRRRLEENRSFLARLAKLDGITWIEPGQETPLSATGLVGGMEVLVPMADLIDREAEAKRLGREIEKTDGERNRTRAKLDNPGFVDKAPAAVVERERAKLGEQDEALERLRAQLASLQALG
jgi:valyl-tRNA synthetase